jgi:L-alanine-DL-glutamate epimerase-like enolase superfamily enzyme
MAHLTKIHKIEIIPVEIPLKEPFVISKGALTHAKNTIIKIYNTDGTYGTGECCPYRSIHGETQKGTIAFAEDLAKVLIGSDPREIAKIVSLMDRMIVGNASVKCAFDMALYDLASKMDDLPLYAFLQGSRDKEIYTDNTVSLLEPEKMAHKAVVFKEMGFPVLKVKLGGQPADLDIKRIYAIRKSIGDDLPLRIDANQGWNYMDARQVLDALEDMGIEHCEEPVRAGNLSDQRRLVDGCTIPIMADETVFSHRDAIQVIKAGAADMFNIKLGKSGGLHNAMKIAAIAEAADMYCQVGSFSESRLGITALVHFDYAWNNIKFHDLDSPLMLAEDPVLGGMTYNTGWKVDITDDPGHGADFDPVFLNRFDILTIR